MYNERKGKDMKTTRIILTNKESGTRISVVFNRDDSITVRRVVDKKKDWVVMNDTGKVIQHGSNK